MFILGKAKKDIPSLTKEIFRQGSKFYDGFKDAKLIIGGDGASWIQNLAFQMKAEFVLDKYHALKYLKQVFNINMHHPKFNLNNYRLYKICEQYFDYGLFNDLIKVLREFADSKIVNYFKNNRWGVENFGESWNIGVSAESDISKLVKSIFGYGSRIYSFSVFRNMIYSRAYIFNKNV